MRRTETARFCFVLSTITFDGAKGSLETDPPVLALIDFFRDGSLALSRRRTTAAGAYDATGVAVGGPQNQPYPDPAQEPDPAVLVDRLKGRELPEGKPAAHSGLSLFPAASEEAKGLQTGADLFEGRKRGHLASAREVILLDYRLPDSPAHTVKEV